MGNVEETWREQGGYGSMSRRQSERESLKSRKEREDGTEAAAGEKETYLVTKRGLSEQQRERFLHEACHCKHAMPARYCRDSRPPTHTLHPTLTSPQHARHDYYCL